MLADPDLDGAVATGGPHEAGQMFLHADRIPLSDLTRVRSDRRRSGHPFDALTVDHIGGACFT
ncbi:MAG: hypothetical protein JO287_00225 [Pseudonocardiales bacterium]|nr:hypothetical protein [Pseudonocardiales bacterium]